MDSTNIAAAEPWRPEVFWKVRDGRVYVHVGEYCPGREKAAEVARQMRSDALLNGLKVVSTRITCDFV